MKTVTVKDKEISSDKLENAIVQNERNINSVVFKFRDGLTDDLYYYLVYRNEDGTGGVEDLSREDEDQLSWSPSHSFTSAAGKKSVQIIAVDEPRYETGDDVEIRWSSLYVNITIPKDIETSDLVEPPEQSQIEDLICEEVNEL